MKKTTIGIVCVAVLVGAWVGQATPAQALASLTSSSLPRSLEGLGQPTEGFGVQSLNQGGCYGYKTVAEGAHLQMAGATYSRGFQATTSAYCGSIWTWAWHIGGQYRSLQRSGRVGRHRCRDRLRSRS